MIARTVIASGCPWHEAPRVDRPSRCDCPAAPGVIGPAPIEAHYVAGEIARVLRLSGALAGRGGSFVMALVRGDTDGARAIARSP